MAFRTRRDLERLSLPPGKSEVFHFDARCSGLAVRIQRTGKPTFVTWFTAPGGKRKRLTIGPVAGVTLEKARTEAANITAAARNGRDPAADRKQARVSAAEVLTVGDLIRSYLRQHAERHQRPRTLIETKRHLERHWAPLHQLPAATVDRRIVSARLIELAETSGRTGANRARAALSGCFAWGMRAGLTDCNPVLGTVRNDEASRDRVLSPAELRAIWQATAELTAYDCIIRLLMLTGARRLEVGAMAWAELSEDRALWILSSGRTKNGRPHEVPLPRQARDIIAVLEVTRLERQRKLQERGLRTAEPPFLFGRGQRTPFSGWSQSKTRLNQRIVAQEGALLADWRLHDLRRTAVTMMAEHGLAQPHIIEACVGHASGHKGGVAGIYNRAIYRQEKAAALQRWADWLEGLVEGKASPINVVALRR